MRASGGDPAAELAAEVARAARRPGAARTLILDVDGTLAPIVARPSDARVPRATLAALERLLADGWRVAVVSGRPAAQARKLVPLRGVRVFGSHGAEGPGRRGPPRVRGLEPLRRAAERLAREFPGAFVERKPAGLAFHDRRVPDARLAGWRRALRALLATHDPDGFERLRGRRVLELRARGVHKGRVAERLAPPRGGRRDASLVAVGDDRTDEDMFATLAGRGLTVRVGRRGVRTRAERRLASPASVGRFLRHLGDDA